MKKLFYKEVPLVEPHHDAPTDNRTKRQKLTEKTNHILNKHPLGAAAVAVGVTHVACYGMLAYVSRP